MFEIDNKDIKHLENSLIVFAEKALPYATRNTINKAAFHAQKKARQIVKRRMIQRNRYTLQSIQVKKAEGQNINSQYALMGSVAPYLEIQQFGGRKKATGKKGVGIPTSFSAGMGLTARPRKRLPMRSNQLKNIKLKHRRTSMYSRKQRNKIAVLMAAKSGNKFIYMDLGTREGIFKVTGGKSNPQVRMVHDLSRKYVDIPRRQWINKAIDRTVNVIPKYYEESLIYQLKKNRVMGY